MVQAPAIRVSPRTPVSRPSNSAALLRHEDAVTSAAVALDAGFRGLTPPSSSGACLCWWWGWSGCSVGTTALPPAGCSEGLSGSLGAPWWGCLVMRIQATLVTRIAVMRVNELDYLVSRRSTRICSIHIFASHSLSLLLRI